MQRIWKNILKNNRVRQMLQIKEAFDSKAELSGHAFIIKENIKKCKILDQSTCSTVRLIYDSVCGYNFSPQHSCPYLYTGLQNDGVEYRCMLRNYLR